MAEGPGGSYGGADWDAAWEKRAKKLLGDRAGSHADMADPQHRRWVNKQLKKQKASAGGGGETPAEEPPAETAPPPGEAEGGPPDTGGVDTMPPEGTPGAPGAPPPGQWAGGWLPNAGAAVPWGGGGRGDWTNVRGGAGYPGAPSYPGQGQAYPLPGQPGGSAPGGYPGTPPVMTGPGGYPGPTPPGYPGGGTTEAIMRQGGTGGWDPADPSNQPGPPNPTWAPVGTTPGAPTGPMRAPAPGGYPGPTPPPMPGAPGAPGGYMGYPGPQGKPKKPRTAGEGASALANYQPSPVMTAQGG